MKELTIREAREGLSHPEQMFADAEEILVVRRGEPVARILPVAAKRSSVGIPSRAALRARIPFQTVPSEVTIRAERDERD
ncbi:MAG: type II toxin-antitoxin system prevent-host-death family antitoxin [Betaproteobacteria bacterium]|nr:type II toxin-antitoxin system prevent-host-death family antitoxin [Betaproteobacteria bacterium]